jgi:hypothetical protein
MARWSKVNRAVAICLDYNGIDGVTRVESFDNSNPQFFVDVKCHDLECVTSEMGNETVSVYLAPFLRSIAKIDALVELSRPSGVWIKKV